MKFASLLAPAALLAGAAILIPAETLVGFTTIGGSLSLDQRDFRVFDNFGDSTANDNQTADSQFPGYTGAAMALWKGAVEWSSIAHGDGSGDSTQSQLGGSGANFDPSWQGLGTGVGNANGNTVSAITGSSNGVLAFAELPSTDGWRIRFYETWIWNDGPGNIPSSHLDLQGIMTHEYGHALGLDHSSDSASTMRASVAGNGVANRQTNADDHAGAQFIYGALSAGKPRVDSITKCGDDLTIHGSNFAPTGNQVWFTQSGTGGFGEPIRMFNVDSTQGGTEIALQVPATAGSGDLLVRRSSSNAFDQLSNPFPIDVDIDTGICGPILPPIVSSCFGDGGTSPGCTSCPCNNDAPSGSAGGCENSSGTWGILFASGTQSVSNDTLRFDILGASTNTFAILSSADNALPNVGAPCPSGSGIQSTVLDGLRCIGGNLLRHGTRATNGLGSSSWGPPGAPNGGILAASGFVPGQVRHFQVFYRDLDTAGCGTGQNTTNALTVEIVL